jgi:hypothetical protein
LAVPLTKDFVAAVRNAGDIVRLVSDYVPSETGGNRLKGSALPSRKDAVVLRRPPDAVVLLLRLPGGGDAFKFVMLYEKLDFPNRSSFSPSAGACRSARRRPARRRRRARLFS